MFSLFLHNPRRRGALALAVAMACGTAQGAATPEAARAIEALNLKEIQFYLYNQNLTEGIVHTQIAEESHQIIERGDEARLLLAGLYLADGMYNEALEALRALSDGGAPAKVPERAWINLARLYYQRGLFAQAEAVLARLSNLPAGAMQAERDALLADVYFARSRFGDAAPVLRGTQQTAPWNGYGRLNLGFALNKTGRAQEGLSVLEQLAATNPAEATDELRALIAKANLQLGFDALARKDPQRAKSYFLRATSHDLYAGKAWLALGWAEQAAGNDKEALNAWLKLKGHDGTQPEAQEALLAASQAYLRTGDHAQARASFQYAADSYTAELGKLKSLAAAVNDESLLRMLAGKKAPREETGFYWQPEFPATLPLGLSALTPVFTSHAFQEALKNYRELFYTQRLLETYLNDLEAYRSLLATRRSAYRERLPRALARSNELDVTAVQRKLAGFKNELSRIESTGDVLALATSDEMHRFDLLKKIDERLDRMWDVMVEAEDLDAKYKLLYGRAYWEIAHEFMPRLWNARKHYKELDQALSEAVKSQDAMRKAMDQATQNSGDLENPVQNARIRTERLRPRAQALREEYASQLKAVLLAGIKQHETRLANYKLQAQFGIAQSYDHTQRAGDEKEDKAIESYLAFLAAAPPDNAQRHDALLRVAELEMSRAEKAYLKSLEQGGGKNTKGNETDYQAAIDRYKLVLNAYPAHPGNDVVFYQLAKAYDHSGDIEGVIDALGHLVTAHPTSVYADEAHFRRGELFFAMGSFNKSAEAYGSAVVKGSSSPFYERALYKHGWAVYKQGDLPAARNSFTALLDRKLDPKAPPLTTGDKEVVDDALRVMSLSFAQGDGSAAIGEHFARIGARPYEYKLYESLAGLYLQQERIEDAARTYRTFTTQRPDDMHAPQFQDQVITAYQKGGFNDLMVEAKREFVTRYQPQSSYWSRNPAHPERAAVLNHFNAYLQELAHYDHAEAQRTRDSRSYARAEQEYRLLLASFPGDAGAPKTHFLLAESLFENRRYAEAAVEYAHTAYDYPMHDKAAEAGYAALLAYDEGAKPLSGAELETWRRKAIADASRFAGRFPKDDRAAAVLAKAARQSFELNDLDNAAALAQRVVEMKPDADVKLRRTAYAVLAHSRFERNEYPAAEQAYQQLVRLMDKGDPERDAMLEKLAAAAYKQGEQAQTTGDLRAAVQHFLRVGKLAPAARIRATADFDAAAALIALEDWKPAIAVLEQFRGDYPQNPLQKDVTVKLAVAYQQTGDWRKAAVELEKIAATGDSGELRRDAAWQSAGLFVKAGQREDATRAYENYVKAYPEPLEPAIEARAHLADIHNDLKNGERARFWLKDLVAAEQRVEASRTARTRDIAAHAALTLADVDNDAFRATRLVNPLEKSLKLKRQKMETALASYNLAAGYGIADVTTAATYRIGEIYADLSRDLMASERPKGLDKDELEQYDILLEEQAYPFEEQAISVHEANSRRARDGIYDDWVQKSYAALGKLLPARYNKQEKGESVGHAIH